MDAQQFLAEFGHVANAPGGVTRLRELVLSLAVQGRLVHQQSSDAPASTLIEKIRSEKTELVRQGLLKREKTTTPIKELDFPHQLPNQWEWIRLGAAAKKITDGTHHSPVSFPSGEFKYLTAKNINPWGIDLSDVTYVPESVHSAIYSRCDPELGDILYIKDGATTGILTINTLDEPFSLLSSVGLIKPSCGVKSAYLALVMRSPFFYRAMRADMKGVAITRVTLAKLEAALIPLPPLAEQSRIVAKVDELMALCDQLEKQQQERRKLQNALRQSTLQALASAQSPHELRMGWERLQANFGRLFSEPGDVRQFRDVLFDLSLRGLTLVNSKLSAEGEDQAAEFGALPDGWTWSTLAKLSEYITSGSRGWKAYISNSGDSFIRSQDIRQDALVFENPAFVTLPDRAEGKRTLVREGDLLLTITGGNVGRCAAVPSLKNKAYVSQHVALIRLNQPELAEFIHYWMINAYGGRAFLARYIYGDKPGLNLTQVGSVPVPIPPATDLLEILASLRKHQRLCDELADQLGTKTEVASKFATAAVAALTGINIEQAEDTAMKAPQTELVSLLRLATPPDVKAQAPLATILARHQGEMAARDLWQRFSGEIDAFYAQLKTEVAHGWIAEPEPAQVREKPTAEPAKA